MLGSGADGRADHARGDFDEADGLGGQVPHAEGPRQRRHAARRQASRASSAPRASACAAPSTCSSSEDRIAAVREMILADDIEGAAQGAGQDPPDAERGLHRHLPGDGRPAGDHPPARPAAARVPPAQPTRRSRSWRARSASRPQTLQAQARAACTSQPDARPPRLPPRRSPSRRSTRCRCAPSSRRPASSAARGVKVDARDHDPAGRHAARARRCCARSRVERRGGR